MHAQGKKLKAELPLRTEEDLRTALATLERLAPAPETVFFAVATPTTRRAQTARKARPPRRPRLVAGIAAMAAVAVVAAAAGLVLVSRPSAGSQRSAAARPGVGVGGAASSAAVRRAILTAFDSAAGDVLQAHTTFTLNGVTDGAAESWSGPMLPRPGQRARYRFVLQAPGGAPSNELEETYIASRPALWGDVPMRHAVAVAGVATEVISVFYKGGAWFESTDRQMAFEPLVDSPALLRREISLGYWKIIGHVELGGRPAIELRWTSPSSSSGRLDRYLWVGARTYLPLRQVVRFIPARGTKDPSYVSDAMYRLLPPTAGNLAKLRPVIPVGFAQLVAPKDNPPLALKFIPFG